MFDKMLSIAIALAIALAFMCANMAKAQHIVTEGLVSYWSLDKADMEGDTVKDVWGENDGTIMGDPQIVKGKVGEALQFDGKDDRVEVAADPSLNSFTGELTLEAWVNTSFSGARQAIINNRVDPPWYLLNIDPAYLMLSLHDGAEAVDIKPGDVSISDGNWHHFVGTMDNTEPNGAKIYADGELISDESVNKPPTAIDPFDVPRNTVIGSRPDGTIPFNGIIDEVRIYNRALSEEEVRQNMEAEGLAVVDPQAKLTATWGSVKVQH